MHSINRQADPRHERAPLVSVIVPVYNIETLIEACVRSILRQSYRNLDIILVDDGSTDCSRSICEGIALTDDRVRVLSKANGGLSDARNHGIQNAWGEFITCVDGDDLVARHYVQSLMGPLLKTEADLSTIGFLRVREGFEDTSATRSGVGYEVLAREEALERLFLQNGLTTSAWGKMYRRSAFEGIEYPRGAIHEDLPVTYRLIARSRATAVIHGVGYFYVQRSSSITGRADYGRRVQAVRFAEEAVEFCRREERSLVGAAQVRAVMECAFIVSQVPRVAELRNLDPVVLGTLREYRRDALAYPGVPAMQKLTVMASYPGLPSLWMFMRARSIASSLRTTLRSVR
ncbi:glycosyltransferase family 2 protein [Microbacterium sp. p3-SID337]|uniref:glycosyltransferase family 2 protein n=1 Tax=Microbacterium sp. p3-SID337 TaxID=2916213 RepID=UPI0021A6962B|nr:glycosyltransferase family 2 protein [Microbacterium sp. p3-SID337]MCT1377438.1 glycosyltransferase [Microbacterium sp. p3-SID337]